MHKLLISEIIFGENLAIIPMSSILKHTTERSYKFTIELRAYDEDPGLCVVRG